MKQKRCCFIGHRNLKDYDIEKIETALEEQINQLQEKGVKCFFSSCRLGFETLAALKVIEMQKRISNDLNLYIVSNYHKKEKEMWFKNWSKKDIETYEYIKKNSRKEYVAISKSDGNLLGAHKDIIDLSTYVLVAFNGIDLGATPGAVAYSILQNKKIIYLDMISRSDKLVIENK